MKRLQYAQKIIEKLVDTPSESKMSVLHLNQDEVVEAALLEYAEAYDAIEQALTWHEDERSSSDKVCIELDPREEWKFNSLIAVDGGYTANKWVGSRLKKESKLPRSISTIVLNDKETGAPLAIMDGTLISAVRTGIYAAVGLKYFGKNTNTIGIIGSGVMARSAAYAMLKTRPDKIGDMVVHSRNPENAQKFSDTLSAKTGQDIRVATDLQTVTKESDVVVAAFTKTDSVPLSTDQVKPGQTRIHIGGWFEEEDYLINCARHGKIITDDWEHVKKRNAHPLPQAYHKGLIHDKQVHGNIGGVISGEIPGREGDEDIYFDTVGLAELDMVLAMRVYETARQRGIGRELPLWENPHWIISGKD